MSDRLVLAAEEVSLGHERVLRLETSRSSFLFGVGPAHGSAAAAPRIRDLLLSLHPAVRAVRWCEQVHGRCIASLSEEPARPFRDAVCVGRCDGLLSAERCLGLLVWTADCVPVLLAGGGVVAAVHAGWRGAAAGIVAAVVGRFGAEYGVQPDSMSAFVGPAVGECHYPVGQDVVVALAGAEIDEERWLHSNRVDLRGFVAAQLESLGVTQVLRVGGCTACSPEFASYRRDGSNAGRQFSLVYRH